MPINIAAKIKTPIALIASLPNSDSPITIFISILPYPIYILTLFGHLLFGSTIGATIIIPTVTMIKKVIVIQNPKNLKGLFAVSLIFILTSPIVYYFILRCLVELGVGFLWDGRFSG